MKFAPLFNQQKIFHGCDYNPEQWLENPEILEKDLELMKKAHCNIVSLGIFAWSTLEPEEGVFNFAWLDEILDKLNANGIKVFLATPSGARPNWMSQKYPEVLRVNDEYQRAHHGGRHNHCNSSPVYREKVKIIDSKLAERYAHHPAVIGWHISNEFSGSCHCEYCQKRFRQWLQNKYKTLDNLNRAYWSKFWSHTYSSWDQIEAPSKLGESCVHLLNLDWRRFNTELCMDFCKAEIDTVKAYNPSLPATTNFMEYFYDYDYGKFQEILDFISWDSYPQWHVFDDPIKTPAYTAMNHDLMRGLKKDRPWVLMESTPSMTNWRPTSKLKKPGMHELSSIQALAHGADNIQYFQWRKSRGSSEKFHGAVVDHVGHIDTRVGREVTALGDKLEHLGNIAGSLVDAKVALIFDTQNRWALDDAQGPRNCDKQYLDLCQDYYKVLWSKGINVDVIDETVSLDGYKVVIAPMTYMLRGDYAKRVEQFVKDGGTYITTYWSGIVDDNDLCYLGGCPGNGLDKVLGIWNEEIECLEDGELKAVVASDATFKNANYKASSLCALIHAKEASVLATFNEDFYKGMPALTCNEYGKGRAYYVASRMDDSFLNELLEKVLQQACVEREIATLPYGVTCHTRYNEGHTFTVFENYLNEEVKVQLDREYVDLLTGLKISGQIALSNYGYKVLVRS